MIQPLRWHTDRLDILDQRLLPTREVWLACVDEHDVADAITGMAIRGAPAIGVAAAFGVALAARAAAATDGRSEPAPAVRAAAAVLQRVEQAAELLGRTRPTAVNLFWALERVVLAVRAAAGDGGPAAVAAATAAATNLAAADIASCRRIGSAGRPLLARARAVYTHCNTGGLATAGYGTALGVIRAASEHNPNLHVYVGETRPYLQGARLTAWELQQEGISFSLCVDSAAGYLMARGKIDAVIVGADRVAANGDTANKIGTYGLAVLAQKHAIPFYVAAPLSTIDLKAADGGSIPIEERPAAEVTHFGAAVVAAPGAPVVNPSFDVTPAELITAIITDAGAVRAPWDVALHRLKASAEEGAQHA